MTLTIQKLIFFSFNSTGQSIIMDINGIGSAIIVVEDNGKDSIGQHSKKDDDRQDPSLWRRKVLFWQLQIGPMYHGKWVGSSPVISRFCRKMFFQHLSPATTRLSSSSFTLIVSMVAIFSLHSAFLKTWQGRIYSVKCTNRIIKGGLQPVEEPPWLQSQPRNA